MVLFWFTKLVLFKWIVGQGEFGKVCLEVDKETGEFVAVKMLGGEGTVMKEREVAMQSLLKPHPNILSIRHVTMYKGKLCIITQL
jgi:serine/threonine protein kinase